MISEWISGGEAGEICMRGVVTVSASRMAMGALAAAMATGGGDEISPG